jgi:hypothetical protein
MLDYQWSEGQQYCLRTWNVCMERLFWGLTRRNQAWERMGSGRCYYAKMGPCWIHCSDVFWWCLYIYFLIMEIWFLHDILFLCRVQIFFLIIWGQTSTCKVWNLSCNERQGWFVPDHFRKGRVRRFTVAEGRGNNPNSPRFMSIFILKITEKYPLGV